MNRSSAEGNANRSEIFSPSGRAMLYEFLSFMLTRNPSEDMVLHLTSDEQMSRLKKIESTIARDLPSDELRRSLRELISALGSMRDGDRGLITKLQEEHARLLRGIRKGYGPPPPYESVYRSGQLMSDHVSEVQALYRRAGLEVLGGEPPDHIGFELAFMAFLCRREEEYRSVGDSENAQKSASSQDDFLLDHIMKWVPQFCTNVLDHGSPFYGPVAELTMGWLRLEEKNANDRRSA